MALDPVVEMILSAMAEQNSPPIHEMSPDQARAMYSEMKPPPSEATLASVEDVTCPNSAGGSIAVRLYRPSVEPGLPILMYFHGGGWVIGDLETHDSLCRDLAAATHSLVASVDYRLAPEHPYPAACEDCYAATLWMAKNATELNADGNRIAVAGDSAGGNLSTVVALMARDQGQPDICFQSLLYPTVDAPSNNASYRDNAEGYMLTAETMRWFWNQYAAGLDKDPLLTPLHAESLAGLPPALVITAEYDPLRDEGEAYAQRLKEAGVQTDQVRYDGMIHGFIHMHHLIPAGKQALELCADKIRNSFS